MDITGPVMNPISAGLRISPVYTVPQTTPASTANNSVQAVSSSTSSVSLGQGSTDDSGYTYSSRGTLAGASVRYVLQQDSMDKLGLSLLSGVQSSSVGDRLQGVGSALLKQLAANGGQSIAQAAFRYSDAAEPDAAALKLRADSLREAPGDAISLTMTSASGATIHLSLASDENGLAVSATVEGGELNENELKGLAALADGFQSAIDGLTRQPPSLKLDALVKFDSNLFGSLKLNATLQTASGEPQVFDLSLDDKARSLSLQGPSGNLELNLDTRDSSLLGNASQRQAAISNYLQQFDAAQKRGNGDKDLVNLFKDAFTQLNSVDDDKALSGSGPVLGRNDRVLLSGLADFSASIGQAAKSVNPLLPGETDHFSYKVSQSTSVRGEAQSTRSVQQDQQSSLKAAWHTSLNPEVELTLGSDKKTQNYRYHQIDDQANSSTRMAWNKDNKRVEASATQQSTQNERVRTYVDGVLSDDVSTPKSVSQSRNLLGLLDDAFQRERESLYKTGVSVLEAQLTARRSEWSLQADAGTIRTRE